MKRVTRLLAIPLIAIFFFQCQRNLDFIGGPDPVLPDQTLPDPIQAVLQGNVVDEANQPAAGVAITIGAQTTTTNASGYFRLNDASLDKNTSLVIAEKTGYFKAYRVFGATSGANQVQIKLVKKLLAATVPSSAGGVATLSNGAKISLPANGVTDAATGAAYSGDIRIYAAYIDPTSADISQTVPGSFLATNSQGKKVVLSSYGMLAVELESNTGVKLQLKAGSTATLTAPIPATMQATATATIPLWYVDEKTGTWKEEGSATKQGNNFVGEVKHFSFWNYDYPFGAVMISMTLQNAAKAPLVHVPVKISISEGASTFGLTDSLGQVKGYVPSEKTLVVEVFDPCGKNIYSNTLQPLTKVTDLGVLTVSSNTSSLVTFQGKVLDCNNQPIKKGYAMLNFNNAIRYAPTNANGEYSISFITCAGSPATATVIGVDQTAQQQGSVATVSIVSPITTAPNLLACGTSSVQFINYTLDGTDYKISSTASDSIYAYGVAAGSVTFFGSQTQGIASSISFGLKNVTAAGTFPLSELAVQNYRRTYLKTPFNLLLTTYAKTSGEFYEGSFTGQFTVDSSATIHNITSSFKVRRN